ncbi:O-antigen ligase family protein [Halobaculum halobium]|nr:O-antigen ligase family protein [Halobaculum sp. SYNS20]
MIGVFFVGSFAFITAIKERYVRLTHSDIGIFVLLSILIASSSWSPSPYESMRRAIDLGLMMIYYGSIVVYLGRDDALQELIRVLLIISTLWVGYGVFEIAFGDLTLGIVPYISRNELSRNLLALIPLMALVTHWKTGWTKVAYVGLTASMIFLIPLSGSRGGIVGLVFVLGALTILFLRSIAELELLRLLPAGAVAVILFGLVVLAAVHIGIFPQRLTSIPLTAGAFSPEVLGPQRYDVHKAELVTIQRHWLTGVGYEGFVVLTEKMYEIGSFRAHNLITRVWMAAGIGPVLILLATGLSIIRNYTRAIYNLDSIDQMYLSALFIGFGGITVAGMVNIVIDEPLWYVLIAVGSNLIPEESNRS